MLCFLNNIHILIVIFDKSVYIAQFLNLQIYFFFGGAFYDLNKP